VGIVGFNSAWSCCGEKNEKGRLWLGGNWQLQALRKKVKEADVRVALMHHPINWMNDVEDVHEVKSGIRHVFDFFLHGHEHDGWVTGLRDDQHIRIGADACYESSRSENGYNVVRLNFDEGTGEVWLRKYSSEAGGGWIPRTVPHKTDDKGVWSLNISWLKAGRDGTGTTESAESNRDGKKVELTGPEQRGVFGRAPEIDRLSRTIQEQSIVTVYGMAGIGKSALIDEVRRSDLHRDRRYATCTVYPETSLTDLYRQIAPVLGSREDVPEPPPKLFDRPRDYSTKLGDYAKEAAPSLVHLNKAHHLFDKDGFRHDEIAYFLQSVAEHVSQARIVLESQEQPPSENALLRANVHEAVKVKGVGLEGMRIYFRHPFGNKAHSGWQLSEENAAFIFERLGGDDASEGAHPLGMMLVAAIADAQEVTPKAVLKRHEDVLTEDLNRQLFNDLYENVLSVSERRMLELCALYREKIPAEHVDHLSEHVDDKDAFDQLVRRCLVNPRNEHREYVLHALIGQLTRSRIDQQPSEWEKRHECVAKAWLEQAQRLSRPTPYAFRVASEAAHHLLKAQRYDLLDGLKERVLRSDVINDLWEHSKRLNRQRRLEDNQRILELLVAVDDEREHMARRFLGETLEKLRGIGDEEALQHHLKAHEIRPQFSPYLNNVGRSLRARDEADRFVALVEELPEPVRREALNDETASTYAQCLASAGRDEDASQIRQERIRAGSRHPAFFDAEAAHLQKQGQLEDALQLTRQAEEVGALDNYIWARRVSILQGMERCKEAYEVCRERIEDGTNDPIFYNQAATWLRDQGALPEALEVANEAIGRGVADERSYAEKWLTLQAMGDEEKASAVRQKRIEAGTKDPFAYTSEAEYLSKINEHQDALDLLEKAEIKGINDPEIQIFKARILAEKGNEPGASEVRQRLIARKVENIYPYHDEASFLNAKGEPEKALPILEEAKSLGISNDWTAAIKAKALEKMGCGGKASDLRQKYIQARSENTAFYHDEANYLISRGRAEEALELLDVVNELGKVSDFTTGIRAKAMEANGDGEAASSLRQRKIKNRSGNPIFYNDEAAYLIEKKRLDEAKNILDTAVQMGISDDTTHMLQSELINR
jgi:predicted Zn-dependent protease